MKPCFLTLTLIAGCATLATPAVAQSAPPPGSEAETTTPRAAAVITAASADARARVRASSTTTVTAAGSVIILDNGIVANATIAQVQPPAPGFVYER